MRDKILDLIEKEGELPPLPDIVIRLREMTQSLKTNIKDIAKLIEIDPVLAWNIIKLSNSVYYSRSTTAIKTLPLAITKIGLNMLVKLVYSLKLCPLFTESTFLSNSQFWLHSLAVAIFAQSLSGKIKLSQEKQEITYLAGLMHDIGIMAFAYLIPIEYDTFLKDIEGKDETLFDQEQEIFGIDHAELGALYIDRWWDVDKHITHTVRNHHEINLDIGSKKDSTGLVSVANKICNSQGITNGINYRGEEFDEDVLSELGLSTKEIENILNDVQTSLEQAKELVSHGLA
ncbi:MAG: HDOD domain-containing protein [Candidatus Latescibacteria bacterium]|nr:HDOD domain-containing protein [Candidatus Latescibacterota bacterium]